jgi:hypothetical protein
MPGRWRPRQILRHGLVETDLALLDELHSGRRGELLRDRGELEDGVWSDGGLEFDTRETVPRELDDLTALDDRQSQARDLPARDLRANVIIDRICPGRLGRFHEHREGERGDREVANETAPARQVQGPVTR